MPGPMTAALVMTRFVAPFALSLKGAAFDAIGVVLDRRMANPSLSSSARCGVEDPERVPRPAAPIADYSNVSVRSSRTGFGLGTTSLASPSIALAICRFSAREEPWRAFAHTDAAP